MVLNSVIGRLEKHDAKKHDIALIEKVTKELDELFMLVVVGEFNSGKSSFINALLGGDFLKQGVTPTTAEINVIGYGDEVSYGPVINDVKKIAIPSPMLKDVRIVDTPGTNAVIRSHERITQEFVPRSDLILFVTSADRAFSESERIFLSLVGEWRKKVVVVLSKLDLLESETDLEQLTDFVRTQMKDKLNIDPVILPVSARLARKGQEKEGRFDLLRKYIADSLHENERLRLKLMSPIGVAQRTLQRLSDAITYRRDMLKRDVEALSNVDEELAEHKRRISRDLESQLSSLDTVLLKLDGRAQHFIDSELTFSNIFSVLSTEAVQKRFEATVADKIAEEADAAVERLSDWLLERSAADWSTMLDNVRVAAAASGEAPPIAGHFEFQRESLLNGMSEGADKMVKEVKSGWIGGNSTTHVADQLRNAVLSTVAVEVGVAGFASMFSASMFDLTFALPVGMAAVGGLVVLPIRRAQLKAEIHEKMNTLRTDMRDSLKTHCVDRMNDNVGSLQAALVDYREFVHQQTKKVDEAKKSLSESSKELKDLAAFIEKELQ